jgi:hypothetical protein
MSAFDDYYGAVLTAWVRFDVEDPDLGLQAVIAELQDAQVALPAGLAALDLRWWQARILAPGSRVRLLSRTQFAKRWGWKRTRVSRLLAKEEQWSDPRLLEEWRKYRNASGTTTERKRNASGTTDYDETPKNEEKRNDDGTAPERERTNTEHRRGDYENENENENENDLKEDRFAPPPPAPPPPPPDGRQLDMIGPRPAVQRTDDGSKPPKTRRGVKPKLDTRDAWKAAYEARYHSEYPVLWPGADGARLDQLIAQFAIAKEPDRGLTRLRSAIGAYFDHVDAGKAWPKGEPPTLAIFLRDLGKWMRYGDDRLRPRPVPTSEIGPGARVADPSELGPPPDLSPAELDQIAVELADDDGLFEMVPDLAERARLREERRNEIAWTNRRNRG